MPTSSGGGGGNTAIHGHPANDRQMHAFIRDAQLQQSLRMNQMMAPSMPNIAHSSAAHPSNMSSSQSMQNVNMIHPGYYMPPSTSSNYPNGFAMAENQHQQHQHHHQSHQQQQHQHQQSMEMARRRNQQRQHEMYSLDVNVQNSMPNLSGGSMLLSPVGNQNDQMATNYRQNSTLTKAHASQPGINYMQLQQNSPMSPVKQLPPTAPKPQMNRQPPQFNKEEVSPPLPPSATHPLFKNVNEQAKATGNYYSGASTLPPPKSFGTNPWEREEREKEHEMRREHARQWREYQIIELTNLQHRSQAQDEQLKTLILERDFERMAEEQEDLEDENDTTYPPKDSNVQEVIRLAQNSNQMATPLTSMKQVDVKMNVASQQPSATSKSDTASLNTTSNDTVAATSYVQPKSILKHNARNDRITSNSNPSSPSKQAKTTSFADERQRDENGAAVLSNVVRDLNNLSFNDYDANAPTATTATPTAANNYQEPTVDADVTNNNGPPPPPERNSSYVIMSQKQQNIRNSTSSIVGPAGAVASAAPSIVKSTSIVTTTASATSTSTSETNSGQFTISSKKSTTTSGGQGSPNNNNGSTAGPAQSVTNLSLTTMMAIRDNKRVSFHDEDNNPIPVHLTLPDTTQGEDPNVSIVLFRNGNLNHSHCFRFVCLSSAFYHGNVSHAANTNHTRRRIMEHECATDSGCHWCPRGLQVNT